MKNDNNILNIEQMKESLYKQIEEEKNKIKTKTENKETNSCENSKDKIKKSGFEKFIESTNNIYNTSKQKTLSGFQTKQFGGLYDKESTHNKINPFSTEKIKQYESFKKSRKEKAANFNLEKINDVVLVEDEPQTKDNKKSIIEEPLLKESKIKGFINKLLSKDNEDNIEYTDKKDEKTVFEYLFKKEKTYYNKTIFSGLVFLISTIFYIMSYSNLDLPKFLTILSPISFISINLIFTLIAGYISLDVLKDGLYSLLTKSITKNSIMVCCYTVSIIEAISLYFSKDEIIINSNVFLLCPLMIGVLFVNNLSKFLSFSITMKNFRKINKSGSKFGAKIINNQEIADAFTRGSIEDNAIVCYNKSSNFITDFLGYSLNDTILDKISFYLLPISLIVGLVLSIIIGFVDKNIWVCITIFCSSILSFPSFSLLLSLVIPQIKYNKKFSKFNSVFFGYKAVEKYGDINSIVVLANELFPSSSVELNGMRVFNKKSIYDSIIYCASILKGSNSVLKDMFMRVLLKKDEFLLASDSIIFEDNLGISGWVNDKHVIVGNYDIMVHHNVTMPDKEEMLKLHIPDNDILFVSIDSTLTAGFVYSLKQTPNIKKNLDKLYDENILLVTQTVDPVITSQKLAEIFEIPKDMFKILPGRYHKTLKKKLKTTDKLKSSLINDGSLTSFIKSTIEIKNLKGVFKTFFALSFFGMFIQSIIPLFMHFTNYSTISMLIFEFLYTIIISIITFIINC